MGVQFEYEEPDGSTAEEAEALSLGKLTRETFSELPMEWVSQVHEAAMQADAEVIHQLVDQVKGEHPGLARSIVESINAFRFDEIMAVTGPLREPT